MNPQSIAARLALANYYWSSARPSDAEQAITGALEIEPSNVAANRALASFYMANNRASDAETPLRRAAEASEDPQPSLVLSDYLVRQGRHEEAGDLLDKLISRPGLLAAAKSRRAAIEYLLERRPHAYQLLDEILAEQPKNAEVLVLKGKWLLADSQADAALRVAEAAVAADPNAWPVHDLLGSAYVLRNQPEQALAAFSEAVRLNPRALHPQIALSELHIRQGRVDAGVRFAEEAMQSAPTSGLARFVLARALVGKGDLKRARSELQPVLLGSPKSAQVQALLGAIEEREGNVAAATRASIGQSRLMPPPLRLCQAWFVWTPRPGTSPGPSSASSRRRPEILRSADRTKAQRRSRP